MLPKQIIKMVVLVAFCVQGAICRADDPQAVVRALMKSPSFKGAQWEIDKKTLAGSSSEQVVHALISEVDIDCGSTAKNFERDIAAYELFRALDLPPTLVCQELEKPSSPERKASLMFLLRNSRKPEVVQALLSQLNDRRLVKEREMISLEAGMKLHPFRVCDVAYNALADNVDIPNFKRLSRYSGDKSKDKTIQEGLAAIKLMLP